VTTDETVHEKKNARRIGRGASVETIPEHSKFGARVQEVGPFSCDNIR
jgi:hypothetical protein